MATKLASGYIELTVKSNVKKNVNDELADVEKQSKDRRHHRQESVEGRRAGDQIHQGPGQGTRQRQGKAKQTGDDLEKSVTRGAKNAGKSVEKEISDGGKRASKSITDDILDGARKAGQDGGKALNDALVHAAGEGGKAIGKAISDTAVGDWLRDIRDKAEPVLDVTHAIGDAFMRSRTRTSLAGYPVPLTL